MSTNSAHAWRSPVFLIRASKLGRVITESAMRSSPPNTRRWRKSIANPRIGLLEWVSAGPGPARRARRGTGRAGGRRGRASRNRAAACPLAPARPARHTRGMGEAWRELRVGDHVRVVQMPWDADAPGYYF